jgi:cytoskeleton protein RodZ
MSNEAMDTGASTPAASTTAGGLLRLARQARGLHIAALATSIKVSPQKLELLETDRLDQLPGTAFARALAQTVCRFLKIDAAPVMALLPPAPGHGLEQMSRGLNEPFRDRPGRRVPNDLQFLKNPVLLGALAILVAASGISMIPRNWLSDHLPHLAAGDGPAGESVGVVTQPVATSEGGVPPGAVVLGEASPGSSAPDLGTAAVPSADAASQPVPAPALTLASSPVPVAVAAADAAASAASAATSGLELRAAASSWVEVIDKRGVSLLSRKLQPGETVALDGASPLRVKIGNASATQLSFNGQPVDLAPVTSRGNVARIELR